MPGSNGTNDALIMEAVKNGTLKEEVLDQAVERILNIIYKYADHRAPKEFTMEKDHEEARRIAEESMVLLKNADQILPLKTSEKVAFVGGFAKKPRFQGGGSSHINCFKITNALESVPADAQVTYVEGFSADKDLYDEKLAAEALQAAKAADKVVIFAGLPDSFESEGYDRSHMRLPECQNRLIAEILEVQPNTVIVLHNGSPVEMPWINNVKGILEAYLGGQAGGAAVANILYGIVNPSGKLAETIPVKLADNPSYLNFGGGDKVEYREGVFVGYRYYDTKQMEVAYPFGYGLSYTTFTYSNLQISNTNPTEKDTITVSVDVTNTGNVAGKEAVQLYVKDMTASTIRPEKELKGFAKVYLKAGESRQLRIPFDDKTFRYWNIKTGQWEIETGTYQIMVGASVADIRLTGMTERTGNSKGYPYNPAKMPYYYTGIVQKISDEEFRELLGHEIPNGRWSGNLGINDAICQMYYAKSRLARLIYRCLTKMKKKSEAQGKPDLNILFIYNMPFRGIAKMTGGAVSMEMVYGIVDAVNGHFMLGVKKIIGGYFRNRRNNKKYEKLLKGAGGKCR